MWKLWYIIKFTVFLVWGVIQNLVGFIYATLHFKHFVGVYRYAFIFVSPGQSGKGAVTLGNFIFMSPNMLTVEDVTHEYGHVEQSNPLGPFYFFAVGIFSIIHVYFYKEGRYYRFFTESWAEKNANNRDRDEDNKVKIWKIIHRYNEKHNLY